MLIKCNLVVVAFVFYYSELTFLVVKNIFSGLGELLSTADDKQELSTLAKNYSISLT